MFFVRTPSERDLPEINRLLVTTWHATYDGFFGADKVREITENWHSVPALKARLARKDAEFVVADNGKRLGGMGFAALAKDDAATVVLSQLYVLPEFQRQGIGRAMFAELETCFPDAKKVRVEVAAQNAGAIAFYYAHGFERIRVETDEDPALGSIWVMEKPLIGV